MVQAPWNLVNVIYDLLSLMSSLNLGNGIMVYMQFPRQISIHITALFKKRSRINCLNSNYLPAKATIITRSEFPQLLDEFVAMWAQICSLVRL